MDTKREMFYTASLNVVAYLITKGINYVEITEQNGMKLFGFVNSSKLDFVLQDYKNDQNLQSFIHELKRIKAVIKNI